MRNAIAWTFISLVALGCAGGDSGDDACDNPTAYEDWPEPYTEARCDFLWQCDDGQTGTPSDAWTARCRNAYASRLPAEEDACFDRCAATRWLDRAEARIASCADDMQTSVVPIIVYCPDGVPPEQ